VVVECGVDGEAIDRAEGGRGAREEEVKSGFETK
jgi:hypothetical protein